MRGSIAPIDHHADGTQQLLEGRSPKNRLTAPYPGHYEPLVECGEQVSEGQTVGYLHDFYRIDEEPYRMVTEVDGVVIFQAWGARVEQGQALVGMAQVIR